MIEPGMFSSAVFRRLACPSLVVCFLFCFIPSAWAFRGNQAELMEGYRGAEQLWSSVPQSSSIDAALKRQQTVAAIGDIEIPKRINHTPQLVAPPPAKMDPLLSLQKLGVAVRLERAFSTQGVNVEGQYDLNVNPPDTVGDVGQSHYIQAINTASGTSVAMYSKSDGSLLVGPFQLGLLAVSGVCTSGGGDPIVLYDIQADRWLLSEFASSGNNLCVYISQTADPTGSWYGYTFTTPIFPDYPKYGVWADGYYVSTNETFPTVYALDRSAMLNGQAATMQRFELPPLAGFGFQALTPADLDGPDSPPGGAPGYFMRHRDDEAHNSGSNNTNEDYLEVWEMQVDWSTPANSTVTKAIDIAVAEFDSDLCGLVSFECFDQPGTAILLDPLREVIMHRLQYRNFGAYETLVGNFVTDVSGTDHGGIRWFELRKTGVGSWVLHQEGTYAPDSADRWMGSIAMDGCGNIAMGYNIVDGSSTVYPGMRYIGRLAKDAPGTMLQGEYVIASGGDYNDSNRYGDYSAMSIDPVDDRTFWYTGQYNPAEVSNNWRTRIASFQFDSCGGMNILFMLPRLQKN